MIIRDLKCLTEVLGLYPEGPREPCMGFEESHDQLDVSKVSIEAEWRWKWG